MYPYYPQYAYDVRQQMVDGVAAWTDGGSITQCGIAWSHNQYMTVAVSSNSPYQCGQTIKVRNPQNAREVTVTVVDTIPNAPPTGMNLHRRAFEALGANPSVGLLDVQFEAPQESDQARWGEYLLAVTQVAYPQYHVTDYRPIERTQLAHDQLREVYDYALQSLQERITARGTVVYNPITERIASFDIKEL
ncbi:DUF3889 domain-containing protein [Gracilibacillus sp. S3-1-1]|uniref:DUF3889 domain-containing protein n=1 Tax=Gracilibacillus pellucidus TaxID=3095368 RepID=A0ACC6M2C0_9BACI|nr:DUF3889 domain-containing protein [Gracilibacillus sp. S3-1-1]MDX8045090.1 DUF3889 domain-containing protein [Gracilibacillus sp. S3-1-1]